MHVYTASYALTASSSQTTVIFLSMPYLPSLGLDTKEQTFRRISPPIEAIPGDASSWPMGVLIHFQRWLRPPQAPGPVH